MKPIRIAFLTIALIHLVAGFFQGAELVLMITKPLIVPALMLLYIRSGPERSKPLLLALFFCWAGDVALMFVNSHPMWFMAGLSCFLIGHIFYVVTYRQFRWEEVDNELMPVQKIRFSLPVVLAGTGLIVVLYPFLGTLRVPVMIYATVIIVMVMTAMFRFGRTSSASFWIVLAGAILFMVSDSILALNKFRAPIEQSHLLVMGTYIAAQYLIVEGLIRHFEAK